MAHNLWVSLATIVWQADDGSEIQRSSDLTSELIVSANRTHNGKVGFQKNIIFLDENFRVLNA